MAHRVRIVRMRAPQRCRKGIGPRLLNVERDGIGEQTRNRSAVISGAFLRRSDSAVWR